MQNELISIGRTAQMLGVSIDTLRRWDIAGRLQSVRSGSRGHRYFKQLDIDLFLQNISALARQWAAALNGVAPTHDVYCQTRDEFQARLEKLQTVLCQKISIDLASLISATAGEIGNNSFDHNLGNWPDITGIFFS
ncbi:MerR family DNA-binding transcriptional regulator, partial [Candidatus Gottesmanbacteria bacterium]|nr:MerR family DNA-binding transcriptional regulator [Candidatus Gottesmanbacteria bacterium]